MVEIARINDISIKKGDIVEIKFKSIEDILSFYKEHGYRAADVFGHNSLDNHMTSLVRGGFFFVEDIDNENGDHRCIELERNSRNRSIGGSSKPRAKRPDEIVIIDHNCDGAFLHINEHLIESIVVRDDVGEHYFSDKFQLSLLKIDGLLIINGIPLSSEDKDIIKILEKTIADISIRSMLEIIEEDDSNF